MEIRRKKQYLVAGILTLAVGIACANPLPIRTGGAPTAETEAMPTYARIPTNVPQSDITRLQGVPRSVCGCFANPNERRF